MRQGGAGRSPCRWEGVRLLIPRPMPLEPAEPTPGSGLQEGGAATTPEPRGLEAGAFSDWAPSQVSLPANRETRVPPQRCL